MRLRGARPSPRHLLASAMPHRAVPQVLPPAFLMWGQLSTWGNVQTPTCPGYGDCVTAEEAAKLSLTSQVLISDDEVIAWARQHNVLNGAELPQVMRMMERHGFVAGNCTYDDGAFFSVDWHDYNALCQAMYENQPNGNPVKIGIDASSLEQMIEAPDGSLSNGWVAYGYPLSTNYDHCTSLCGFGSASDLVAQFATRGITVTLPSSMPVDTLCVGLFTWGTIGLVDMISLQNMCGEAWVRNPPVIVR